MHKLYVYKKRGSYNIILSSFIVLLIHLGIILPVSAQSEINNETVNVGTSIYVSTQGTMFIPGNVYSDNVSFINNGYITANSILNSEIFLPPVIDGVGVLELSGTGDFLVTAPDSFSVANLVVNTDGNVFLKDDINVKHKLQLLNGIVDVDEDNVLWVTSTNPASIVFDESKYSKSYVIGYLGREVLNSETYYFPVGNHLFHPLLATNIEKASTNLKVRFDESIPQTWLNRQSGSNNIKLLTEMGWEVNSRDMDCGNFSVGLSILNSEDEYNQNYVGVFYAPDRLMLNTSVDEQSYVGQNYLIESQLNTTGVYAVSVEDDLKLANFFYVGNNGNSTQFKIPDAEKYTKITLHVVDRLGKLVFESDHYVNELDVSELTTGTYFYELILHDGNYIRRIHNFIEVKHEYK